MTANPRSVDMDMSDDGGRRQRSAAAAAVGGHSRVDASAAVEAHGKACVVGPEEMYAVAPDMSAAIDVALQRAKDNVRQGRGNRGRKEECELAEEASARAAEASATQAKPSAAGGPSKAAEEPVPICHVPSCCVM